MDSRSSPHRYRSLEEGPFTNTRTDSIGYLFASRYTLHNGISHTDTPTLLYIKIERFEDKREHFFRRTAQSLPRGRATDVLVYSWSRSLHTYNSDSRVTGEHSLASGGNGGHGKCRYTRFFALRRSQTCIMDRIRGRKSQGLTYTHAVNVISHQKSYINRVHVKGWCGDVIRPHQAAGLAPNTVLTSDGRGPIGRVQQRIHSI